MSPLAPTPHPTAACADFELGWTRGDSPIPAEGAGFRETVNGRSALYRVFSSLAAGGGYALFPAFHCPTVVEPALRAGLQAAFYDVKLDLSGVAGGLERESAAPPRVIVVINYFGFEFPIEELERRWPGVPIVEDCSHSFIRADTGALTGGRGAASIYSFWKLLPTHVGGGVRASRDPFVLPGSERSLPVREQVRLARTLARQCLANAGIPVLSAALSDGPPALVEGPVVQPPVDEQYPFSLLEAATRPPRWVTALARRGRMKSICAARRRNFAIAAAGLEGIPQVRPLRPALEDGVCPWAFPVLLDDRPDTDFRLRNAGVPLFTFGETLHPRVDAGVKAPNSRALSRNLLCLPVHQRLAGDDVAAYCGAIRRFFADGRRA